MIRTLSLVALLGISVCLLSGCSGGKSGAPAERAGPGPPDPLRAIVSLPKAQGILGQRGYGIGPIAASSRYLFWTASSSDETDDVLLLRRDLRTGANRVVGH